MSSVDYAQALSTRETPQSRPIPGREADMAQNNAGGFTFTVDDWTRLERFLVLGAPATYYVGQTKNILDNAAVVKRCAAADPKRTVDLIVAVSEAGRAPKNDPAVAALALLSADPNPEVRRLALAALPNVCRIGTHLFQFLSVLKGIRRYGRGVRSALAGWYGRLDADGLAYQLAKYQSREGWSHRDAVRVGHVPFGDDPARVAAFKWACDMPHEADALPRYLKGVEAVKKAASATEAAGIVAEYRLTHESVPPQYQTAPEVWKALLPSMPLTAMVRTLGRMTAYGALAPLSAEADHVVAQLTDAEKLRKARVHPLSLLVALKTYAQGRGDKGSLTWQPAHQIVAALDKAYDLAFSAVEPTGKRFLLALDVSGSMSVGIAGLPLSAREVAACLAMATARVEPRHQIVAFTAAATTSRLGWGYSRDSALTDPGISARDRLDEVIRKTSNLPFGGTDCSLPFLHAAEKNLAVDAFVVVTDNETWAGKVQPAQALRQYRQKSGINAKSVVLATTATGFSIADPQDGGMLDIAGCETNVPAVIADFVSH